MESLNSRSTSGIKGVSYCKREGKWRAHIYHNKEKIHIGYFDTLENATIARIKKANEIFGEFTNSCEKSHGG